jgi:hypothetical protein
MPCSPLKETDVLVENVSSIFRIVVEDDISFDTSVDFQRTTWRYIPEDRSLHNHRCENLRS